MGLFDDIEMPFNPLDLFDPISYLIFEDVMRVKDDDSDWYSDFDECDDWDD